MISRMDMGRSSERMGLAIREGMLMARNKDMDRLNELMEAAMKGSFWRTIYMGTGCICGMTEGCIRESGILIRCMDRESLYGVMAGVMLDSILMIRNKEKESSRDLMAEGMRESDLMENSMVKVILSIQRVRV